MSPSLAITYSAEVQRSDADRALARDKARQLGHLIQTIEQPAAREKFSFTLMGAGIPRGALIEVCGRGKTATAVQLLAEQAKLRVAWSETQFTIYPCAFLQRHADLERVLFIEAESEVSWALMQFQAFNINILKERA